MIKFTREIPNIVIAVLVVTIFIAILTSCQPAQKITDTAQRQRLPDMTAGQATVDRIEFDGGISCFIYRGYGISCVERSR